MNNINLSTQEVVEVLSKHIKSQHGVDISGCNVQFDLEENQQTSKWEVIVAGFDFAVK
ncbi:hypothetical protein D3C71_1247360 [compost metagenome]